MPQGSTPPPKDDQERAFVEQVLLEAAGPLFLGEGPINDVGLAADWYAQRALILLEAARKTGALAPTTQGEPE